MHRLTSSFAVALALLAAVYLLGEMLAGKAWSQLVTWPLLSAALAVILNATVTSRRLKLAFLSLALVTYVAGVVSFATNPNSLDASEAPLPFLYIVGALALILRHIRRRNRVTVDVVFSALNAYLLIGLLFALVYTAIGHADPGLFAPPQDPTEGSALYYFSFVTLTTIGYGDITPSADWVRSIAVLEGLVGQVFLVVLVARLVGMEIAQQGGGSRAAPADRDRG